MAENYQNLARRWWGVVALRAATARTSSTTWLLTGGLLLMTAIVAGTGLTIERFRDNALSDARRGLESKVRLLALHFDRQFEDFSVLQESIAAELESYGIESSDVFRSEMGTLSIHEVLRSKANGWSDVAGANLFGADGFLINSSQRWPVGDIRISDRPYF
jgi:hypothetical protein